MSEGPGRIERAIAAMFFANASMTYSVEELVATAYPSVNRIENKHRRAVRRAANKVAAREWWSWSEAKRPDQQVVYFNLLDHKSYAVGQIRGSYEHRELSHADVIAAMEEASMGPVLAEQLRKAMRPGGAFWSEVERNRAKRWAISAAKPRRPEAD